MSVVLRSSPDNRKLTCRWSPAEGLVVKGLRPFKDSVKNPPPVTHLLFTFSWRLFHCCRAVWQRQGSRLAEDSTDPQQFKKGAGCMCTMHASLLGFLEHSVPTQPLRFGMPASAWQSRGLTVSRPQDTAETNTHRSTVFTFLIQPQIYTSISNFSLFLAAPESSSYKDLVSCQSVSAPAYSWVIPRHL